MSDQPERPYPVDEDHAMYIELVDPTGRIVATVPMPFAPLNKNTSAPYMLQATLVHDDRCARTIASWPLPAY